MAKIELLVEESVITPGQQVTIPVRVTFDRPTRARGIYAEFVGNETSRATYSETYRDAKGHTKSRTKTATQLREIVKSTSVLMGREPMGCWGAVGDSLATIVGRGKYITLEPGPHEFLFDVAIPETALATMSGKNCDVTYQASVQVDRPLAWNHSHRREFTVVPSTAEVGNGEPTLVRYPEDNESGLLGKMFGKNVRLRLALQSNRIRFHEPIRGLLQIESEDMRFKKITAKLIANESTSADGHSDSHQYEQKPVTIGESQVVSAVDGYSTEFEIVADSSTPASMVGTNFSIDWRLEIEVHVAWATNPKISAAVTVVAG